MRVPKAPKKFSNTWEIEYEGRNIDKNPFYRTMDIFNGIFKKNIKLQPGDHNSTNLKTIFVNFGEVKPSRLKERLRPGNDQGRLVFLLECGHEWEGKALELDGGPKVLGVTSEMCGICGADQAYRGFEHEWQHIIFKSDLAARTIFCEAYAARLASQTQLDQSQIAVFLHYLVNAFDDIRVNSLWEKVYSGSAQAIWERWRDLTHRAGPAINTNFLLFIFAVLFRMPVDPQGNFAPLRPIIEWAVERVKYRGFTNMLLDVRIVLDQCMGVLLAKLPPQEEQQNDPKEDSNQNDAPNQEGQNTPQDPLATPRSESSDNQAQSSSPERTETNPSSQESPPYPNTQQEGERAPAGPPNHKTSRLTAPLQQLMDNTEPLDAREIHADPLPEELQKAQNSQATRAVITKILNSDLSDLSTQSPIEQVEGDMQAQIDQLRNGVASKSETSQLTGQAKARVTIIEVTTAGTPDSDVVIEMSGEERFYIQRMRSAFYKAMGKQKAKRGSTGTVVDPQALIQYLCDHQDPDIFENEEVHQGFAYSVLCDMSGSMRYTFSRVCRAVEMLKQALKFPFVNGNLWGFRGGEAIINGDVWMYRYAKDVNWYTGTMPVIDSHRWPGRNYGQTIIPIRCGGITPMNSAISVASAHMWKKLPVGMAKRLFLLTDGSPVQVKTTGQQLSDYTLRQFVAKEITQARKHGIQTYTVVIGEHAIPEEQCFQMFGPRRFWRKVDQQQVGSVLSNLVLANFSKYIKARG